MFQYRQTLHYDVILLQGKTILILYGLIHIIYLCWYDAAAGEGKTIDYTEVIRGIHFIHSRPEDINMRIFRVSCTDLKGHIASNQLTVQLSVAHEDPEPQPAPVAPDHAAIEVNKLSHAVPNSKFIDGKSSGASSATKHATESAGET